MYGTFTENTSIARVMADGEGQQPDDAAAAAAAGQNGSSASSPDEEVKPYQLHVSFAPSNRRSPMFSVKLGGSRPLTLNVGIDKIYRPHSAEARNHPIAPRTIAAKLGGLVGAQAYCRAAG